MNGVEGDGALWEDVGMVSEIANAYRVAAEARVRETRKIEKGSKVRVVKGRKVPIGVEGVVIWIGSNEYRYSRYAPPRVSERVGVKDASGEVHWTAMSNVEVVA